MRPVGVRPSKISRHNQKNGSQLIKKSIVRALEFGPVWDRDGKALNKVPLSFPKELE